MPSFEKNILSSPLGFINGCKAINFAADDQSYHQTVGSIFKDVTGQKATREVAASYMEAERTLEYIARSCVTSSPQPSTENLRSVLQKCSTLSESSIEGIAAAWELVLPSLNIRDFANSQMGELFDLKWKLGVAISSSTCSSLLSPYVSLSFKIRENNLTTTKTLELTYPQFQNFLITFKEVATVMDGL